MSGLYDGLFIMSDDATGSLWNHMTGEAVHGEFTGTRMPIGNLLQMTAGQALAADAATRIAISERPFFVDGRAGRWMKDDAELMDMFIATLGAEDDRRPRMDMGLGIWTDKVRRYYPMERLRANGGYLLDEVDGRDLLVYLEPRTSTPTAVFLSAERVAVQGGDLVLDGDRLIRSGNLLRPGGERSRLERPQQVFTRWYGFSLTFPDPEIYP